MTNTKSFNSFTGQKKVGLSKKSVDILVGNEIFGTILVGISRSKIYPAEFFSLNFDFLQPIRYTFRDFVQSHQAS